jgi:hypothetical protein
MTSNRDAKITISGKGTLNADVVAVGYQAQAQKVVTAAGAELAEKGLDEVKTKLDELMVALQQQSNKLADPQSAFGLAERIAAELSKKKPDKLTLKGFLTAIAEESKSVAEIAAAALSLKGLVAALF